MPRISEIDPARAPEAIQKIIADHVSDGHALTAEKRTLLHNAAEAGSYALDDELQRLIGKRAADFYEYAISQKNGCLVCSICFQNLLKKNGIDFEHFALMGFVFWITKTQQGIARKQSALTHGRSRNGKQRWRKLQHTAAVPEPTSTIKRRIRPTLKHITALPGRRSGRTRKKMWMFWSAWQAPAAPTLARLAICESRIRHLKSCWYSPIRISVLRQSIRTFRLSTGFCPCMVCLKANCLTICGRKVYFCLSIIIFAKVKGSSARTFVRDRTPFLIRRVNHKRCLCIIAIQLFNATATALNCISQICCLNVALIS